MAARRAVSAQHLSHPERSRRQRLRPHRRRLPHRKRSGARFRVHARRV